MNLNLMEYLNKIHYKKKYLKKQVQKLLMQVQKGTIVHYFVMVKQDQVKHILYVERMIQI